MQKRPGASGRSGKGKHSRSYGNGILYTAKRRSTTYNDIIPANELKKKSYFNDAVEGFLSRVSGKYAAKHEAQPPKLHYGRHERVPAPAKETTANAPAEAFFKDKGVLLTSLACIAVVAVSVFAIPVAFAKNGVTVNLLDSGRTFTAQTSAQTVGEFLEKNNIELGSQDLLETSADLPVEDGMDIIIRRAMPLTVNAGADTKDISMIAGTVSEALHLAGVNVDTDDEVYPAADSYVRPGMTIDYIDVQVKYETTTQTIGYKEVTREDDDMLKGDSDIVQYGEEGEKEIKTKHVYKNGMPYSQEVVSEVVTKEPVNEIKAVGTKVIPTGPSVTTFAELDSGGPGADQIREVRNMQATAYWGDTMTSTGVYPRVASGSSYGTVAADPNVLPYGTMLYIPGYGYGRVEDTGGFIHWPGGSNVIDLFMSNADLGSAWGRRNVTVYILK